jgi:hypothetical protein
VGNEDLYLSRGTAMVEDTVLVIIPVGVKRERLAVLTGDRIEALAIKEGIHMNERYLRDGIRRVLLKGSRELR